MSEKRESRSRRNSNHQRDALVTAGLVAGAAVVAGASALIAWFAGRCHEREVQEQKIKSETKHQKTIESRQMLAKAPVIRHPSVPFETASSALASSSTADNSPAGFSTGDHFDSGNFEAIETQSARVDEFSHATACSICMENTANIVFSPCQHLCCCPTCARVLSASCHEDSSAGSKKPHTEHPISFPCPACRQEVTSMTVVYPQ